MIKLNGLEILEVLYKRVVDYADKMDISKDIEIHIGPKAAKQLGINKSISINSTEVPIIIENSIIESELDNDGFTSDVYIFDPKWSKNESQRFLLHP